MHYPEYIVSMYNFYLGLPKDDSNVYALIKKQCMKYYLKNINVNEVIDLEDMNSWEPALFSQLVCKEVNKAKRGTLLYG
jgi:hypothetical protein